MPTDTITTTGAGMYTVPEDVHLLTVVCHGGGGGGGAASGALNLTAGAGAGGGAASVKTYEVSPGDVIPYSIGAGGVGTVSGSTGSSAGGDTWFMDSATQLAKGGSRGNQNSPGAGGPASTSIGDTKFDGGGGATNSGQAGGGGGGAAGDQGAGTTATSGAGGAGGSPDGGAGGAGGPSGNNAAPGTDPGGGGGGGGGQGGNTSGAGGDGQIEVTYTADVIRGGATLVVAHL